MMRKIELFSLFIILSGSIIYYGFNQPAGSANGNVVKSIIMAKTNKQLADKNKHNPPKKINNNQVTIVFDQYGFNPNQFSVPIGTEVAVINKSAGMLNFEALANQPNQLDAMNLGNIRIGQTKKFKVTKLGSWQFQANNSPAIRGNLSATAVGKSSVALTNIELPKYDPSTHSLLLNYTNYGFVPNKINVPLGTKVTILNSTNQGGMYFMQSSSDLVSNSALDVGLLKGNAESTFILNHKGTWHYVNTWEPTDQGQISVN